MRLKTAKSVGIPRRGCIFLMISGSLSVRVTQYMYSHPCGRTTQLWVSPLLARAFLSSEQRVISPLLAHAARGLFLCAEMSPLWKVTLDYLYEKPSEKS